ncbi:hypothetical protein C2G38_2190824 [Gigaspora rosea]|uniref:Uncharacterized protein n=1 Tax=Gigaspora rosea TaxID=44941 RepID=A0A397V155_9GLOM|nr:hypothetical protein C2G38_2190824 [Gigaspora rosea]
MDKDRNEYYGYFEQKLSKWDIIEFLKQCDLEPYGKKVDRYIRCLKCTARSEQKKRKEKAEELLRRYRNKPDQQHVKDWEKTRNSSKISGGSSIHIHNIHNSTLSGNSLTVAGNTSTTKATTETTTKHKREGLRERKVVSYTESSTDIDISSDSNCEESRNSTTDNDEVESDYDFSNFELAYRALGPSKMWVLNSSGRVIEKSMYSLWRREDDFTSTSKLEGWFEIIIWTHLVDFAFRKMETDLRLEFGAIEAERNGEVTKGTKLLAYSLKMSKMLKDMINVLATECNMKEDVLRKLQIAGISPRSEYDANNYHRSSDGICYSHPSSKIL